MEPLKMYSQRVVMMRSPSFRMVTCNCPFTPTEADTWSADVCSISASKEIHRKHVKTIPVPVCARILRGSTAGRKGIFFWIQIHAKKYMDTGNLCLQFSSKTYIILNRYHVVWLQFTKALESLILNFPWLMMEIMWVCLVNHGQRNPDRGWIYFLKNNSVITDFVNFQGYDLLVSSYADVKNNTWINEWSGAVIF